MNSSEYYRSLIASVSADTYVRQVDLHFDPVSEFTCRIEGKLSLIGDISLYVAEYVRLEPEPNWVKYRYHLVQGDGAIICRWDNAPHHRHIASFPHHMHAHDEKISDSSVRNLWNVLAQLPRLIGSDW